MENKKIKMVVCDIDDTLVHKELHLDPRIMNMIQEMKEKNIYFTFATGRMPYRVEVFEKEAGLEIPYVANNGSILYLNGRMIYSKMLKASLLCNTLQRFMKEDPEFTVIFSYIDRECPIRRTSWIEARLHKYKGYDETLGDTDEIWAQEVHKVYVLDDARTGLISRVAKALDELGGGISYFQYGEYSIEIVAEGCSKASGMERLIKYMNMEKDEVMAIGDHTNDIEIVSMAGIGVAVGNATLKLKEIADYVTKGDRADGVMEAVDKFLFGREV